MWAVLGEYWRIVLVGVTGLLVLVSRGRVPRWLPALWGLLAAAVGLAWSVGMSWPGTLVVFAAMVLIASALWLRAEERRTSRQERPVSRGSGPPPSPRP